MDYNQKDQERMRLRRQAIRWQKKVMESFSLMELQQQQDFSMDLEKHFMDTRDAHEPHMELVMEETIDAMQNVIARKLQFLNH